MAKKKKFFNENNIKEDLTIIKGASITEDNVELKRELDSQNTESHVVVYKIMRNNKLSILKI